MHAHTHLTFPGDGHGRAPVEFNRLPDRSRWSFQHFSTLNAIDVTIDDRPAVLLIVIQACR
jgi:hypothetical protein